MCVYGPVDCLDTHILLPQTAGTGEIRWWTFSNTNGPSGFEIPALTGRSQPRQMWGNVMISRVKGCPFS